MSRFTIQPALPIASEALSLLYSPYFISISSTIYCLKCTDCLDGRKERVQFDKITARVSRLCYGLDAEHVDAAAITQKVISGVYQGVTTIELDNLVSRR